jgi:hypothetical protein
MEAAEPDAAEAAEEAETFEPDEIEALLDDESFGDEITFDELSDGGSDEPDDILKTEIPDISEADLDSALEGLEEVDEEIGETNEMLGEPETDEISQLFEEEGGLESTEMSEQQEPSEAGAVESEIEEAPVEPEVPQEMASELPQEDLSEDSPALEEGLETAETVAAPAAEGLIGLSEEKIEAIVTSVIQDVVERVTRETMASVAEKVIREAIDALKQSLESFKDQD